MDRLVWTPAEVVDVDGPRAMLRAYLEQRDTRRLLAHAARPSRVARACDVGCGFGRLTPLLREFADEVIGFEREPGLLAMARHLQPDTEFRDIEALTALPGESGSFDLALVFTVLQHVPEPDVLGVVTEIQRLVRTTGWVLLCEETDPTLEAGDRAHAALGYTCGRPVETYARWFAPWRLVATAPRRIEPDYPRPDVGTYILLAGPDAATA